MFRGILVCGVLLGGVALEDRLHGHPADLPAKRARHIIGGAECEQVHTTTTSGGCVECEAQNPGSTYWRGCESKNKQVCHPSLSTYWTCTLAQKDCGGYQILYNGCGGSPTQMPPLDRACTRKYDGANQTPRNTQVPCP